MAVAEVSPSASDRAKGLCIGAVAILVIAGYAIGGRWRTVGEYGYTIGLAGVAVAFLSMMRTDGMWEKSVSDGLKFWGRFANLYPKFLTNRTWGWAVVALLAANVLFRTVGHLT